MKITKTFLRLGFALLISASAIAQESIPSNANDAYVTKPGKSKKIDLGATIEVDDKGYPTQESIQIIYDEIDYQGAVSAYLQTIPQMALYGSAKTNQYYGATTNTASLIMHNDPSVDGMLTPNRVVTYLFNYPNLAETGPMVYEYPAGETAGLILDMQMRWKADLGLTSPFQGRAVKYLVKTADQEIAAHINKDSKEYEIVTIETNQLFFAFRVLNPTKDAGLEKQLKIYPYAEKDNPKQNEFFQAQPEDDTYFMSQPIGMKYWEQLHEYIQEERVIEMDRFMLARLKAVGIEKGKPFNPTARQTVILEKAALVGEKMAITTSFDARSEDAKYRDDIKWVHPLTLTPSHEKGAIYQIEERIDWCYEAYGVSKAMQAGQPGKGSTYLAAYKDSKGMWLDGENEYVFTVAPDAPAARFWDLSVYRMETRGLLPYKDGDVSSINSSITKDLKKEADGSIKIFFGPGEAPLGYENNFINTTEDMRWFCYLRLYGPTDTYFDRSWPMYDIKKVKL